MVLSLHGFATEVIKKSRKIPTSRVSVQEVSNMAAKAASEGAHRDDAVYEPRELSARERDLAAKFIKLIQGEHCPPVPYSNV